MIIREATGKDVFDLKELYFVYLTKWPPKEEQNMEQCLTHNVRSFAIVENMVTHENYRNKGYASALLQKAAEIAKNHNCYKLSLETGSNRESTLNFYKNNGFEIDAKHSCLMRLEQVPGINLSVHGLIKICNETSKPIFFSCYISLNIVAYKECSFL